MLAFRPDWIVTGGRVVAGQWLLVDQGRVAGLVSEPPEGAERIDLPGRLLLPGLVNGHSHAFQRVLRGRTEFLNPANASDDFWSWRERMYAAAESLTPEELYTASLQAFVEMALAGVTTVGEFHYVHHAPDGSRYDAPELLANEVIRAAREVGLRIALLRVAYGRSGFEVEPNPRQRRFIDPTAADCLSAVERLRATHAGDTHVRIGLAPHSVRAVPRPWLEDFVSFEGAVHMHVAEQPREIEASLAEHQRRPVELLAELGLLSERFTAVHGIHLARSEITLLGESDATVCACPSTERNLGDGIVPADHLLEAGVHVSLGSDSHAAIDLLDEARQLEGHLRLLRLRRAVLDPGEGRTDGLSQRLLTAATRSGARSLGFEGGSLSEGEPADFFTVALDHPSLAGADTSSILPTLLVGTSHPPIRDVAVGGEWIVRDGVHPLAERSFSAFHRLTRRLFA